MKSANRLKTTSSTPPIFAGLDHVDIEPIEDLGMLGQAFGKVLPPSMEKARFSYDLLERGVLFPVFSSTRKPAQKREPASTKMAAGG